MTDNGKARPLAAIVGDRLKVLRERQQLRQSDLADAAAKAGLSWSRSSIAALEAGTRNLSLEEFILLPLVISNAGGMEDPFIPPDALVLLSPHSHVRAERMAASFAALTGGAILPRIPAAAVVPEAKSDAGDSIEPVDDPLAEDLDLGAPASKGDEKLQLTRVQTLAGESAILSAIHTQYPSADLERAASRATDSYDLRFKVARRLDLPGALFPSDLYVQPFSVALWGRSFEVERDGRAEVRGPYPSPRSAQAARGHVTREMINEINSALVETKPSLLSLMGEVERIWEDIEELYRWCVKRNRVLGRTSLTEEQVDALPVVGEMLTSARKALSMSVGEVSEASGFSDRWVYWLESGRPPLDAEPELLGHVLAAMSAAVGLDPAATVARAALPRIFETEIELRQSHRKPSRWRRG